MFVRATREIRAGEELTITYFPYIFTGLDTRQGTAKELLFACECERCRLETQLQPEFSEISKRIAVLVSPSKDEFCGDLVGSMATAAGMPRAMPRTRKGKKGSVAVRKQDGAWVAFSGRSKVLVATTQLANFAERVETLIGSLGMEISAQQRRWIRAGFLEAHLAKYMLETLSEPDGVARIETLSTIVESMMSIIPSNEAQLLGHLLFHAVKNHSGKNGRANKASKDLPLQAIQSFFGEKESAGIWAFAKLADARFDYRTFCVNFEG